MGRSEHPAEGPKRVTIFISSPGDVVPERRRLEQAIDRLQSEFEPDLELEWVAWEDLPLSATEHFQSQIPRPSSTDIVVVIIWWRLGTPLKARAGWPHEWSGPLSGGEVTGTEWEFEEAIHGAEQHDGKPTVLVYQKKAIPRFESNDELQPYLRELERVSAFVERWFKHEDTGSYAKAFRDFDHEAQFEEMVDEHLGRLLQDRRDELKGSRVRWTDSPFRGLASFDVADAAIFFGRTRAQHRLRAMAEARATAGNPWVLVTGASGSGKSSLVGAGLLPDLLKPGLVDGVGATRYLIVRPSAADGDPVGALVEGLLADSALPELAKSPLNYAEQSLRSFLKGGASDVVDPIAQCLEMVGKGLSAHYRSLLVVVVDQLEEVFRLPGERADELVVALDELAGDDVWIMATIRADFLQQLDRTELGSRFDPEGRFLLGAPTLRELGQIVTRPARIAGLSFECIPGQPPLDEVLQAAAARDPASLPLLGYMLEQLWQRRRRDGTLTFDAYNDFGGLEGAIGQRAEDVFSTLPAEAGDALQRVLARLVTVGQGDEARPVSKAAPIDRFAEGSPDRVLVDALLAPDARLLVADEGTVRVAHEAVLTHWPRAAEQLETDRRELQLIDRLESQAQKWKKHTDEEDRASLLVSKGLPLKEAEALLDHRRAELDDDVLDLIEQSTIAHREAHEAELAAELARREEADWRRLEAEKLERRAAAEEFYARAVRTRERAEQVDGETWRHDAARYAAELRVGADGLENAGVDALAEAYRLHRSLADHPGAPRSKRDPEIGAAQSDPRAIFSLEVLPARHGTCLFLHYGTADRPHLAIVDGGARGSFGKVLAPALRKIRERRGEERLTVDLVLVTQYDMDSVGGIVSMFNSLADGTLTDVTVERLWFNNFQEVLPSDAADPEGRKSFKWDLHDAARSLGIQVNSPFDRFVMPADVGPAQVSLPGGLVATILAPPNEQIASWYRRWVSEEEKRGVLSSSDVMSQQGAVREFASSPELTLIRRPPVPYSPPSGRKLDRSEVNMSSVVAHLSFGGRTMLLTGDSRPDFVMAGLFDAWLLDPERGADVDLMTIPHYGSTHNTTRAFLAQVRASEYVVVAMPRFQLPAPAVLDMLTTVRGAEAALYVGGPAMRLRNAAGRFTDLGLRSVSLPDDEKSSVMIDLLDPVEPALP